MKKVGILGGTFDPPHHGHLLIANEVLCQFHLDEIWFLPNQDPPHKEKSESLKNEDRLNMLKLAIKGHPNFIIQPIELNRPGRSYTFDTMMELTNEYKNHRFYFIIGADMIEYLPKWYKVDELLKLVKFIGVNRPNFQKETTYPILSADIPEFSVSSSIIRNRFKEGKTVRYLLPDPVIHYIKEKQLYGT
ncbi:nicotinate-nucleotide adenylyltransferase [Cytobacillus sp. FJAT-54145]|uniref:Probable nicotinate-nucleotide adenylyltransferase n=1 Tax=Cytobacillus spartinae TaxID=3299023 RepID=A0ABW6KG43_9BACI